MKKPLWIIYTSHMFVEVYMYMQVALFPVLIREFQLNVLEVSLVATIPGLVQLLMNIPSGFLAERFNIRHLLFVSMFVEGFSALMVSQTSSFWMLVLGVSFIKVASPIYHISGLSQLSRFAEPSKINKIMGFHNAFGNIGTAFGLVSLAAAFLFNLDWRWVYLFWAIPILIWGLIVLMFSKFKTETPIRVKTKSRGRLTGLSIVFSLEFFLFLLVIGIREIGNTGSSTFMTTYFVNVRELSESTASLIFGLGPFVGILGSLTGGYLGERIGAKKALSWILIISAILLFALSLMAQPYLLVIVYLLYSFFSNSAWSPLNVLATELIPEANRGLGFSVYFLVEGMILSVAPTLAAGVIMFSDVWFVFPFSALFIIASLIVLRFLPQSRVFPNSPKGRSLREES